MNIQISKAEARELADHLRVTDVVADGMVEKLLHAISLALDSAQAADLANAEDNVVMIEVTADGA